MGNPFLLQACLRLPSSEIPDSLEIGREHTFSKEGHRLYQINVSMDLRDSNWNFLARVVVLEYTVGRGITKGVFAVVKQFSADEKEVITKTFVSDKEVSEVLN